jgi:glycerol-3-phosphate dehydrogenase
MQRHVDALTDGTFDLLILGGGITGAGVALDAATRGLRVALIDKGDFAGGTSSVSSKLIHGGLRYLEHRQFALVQEALQERRRLLHNAPHLVRPLRFVIPFSAGTRVPAWEWRLGLTIYDAFAGPDNLQRSRPLTLSQMRRQFSCLQPPALSGGASYFDAQMDDARLCIEVLRTAARYGATVANYVEAVAFEAGAVRAVDHIGGCELTIRARLVLNATGPWVDNVCRLAGDQSGPYLEPTKGVHIITPASGLTAAFLLLHPNDGRVLFVIPWMGKTLIGTTDTVSRSGPDALQVQPEEIVYLLEAYNHYLVPPLGPRDVLGSFAGLRPLLRARAGEPSSRSREFRLIKSQSGLLSLAGGKYTTYRRMAQVATDAVVRQLGMRRRCRTYDLPLDGTPADPWTSFTERMTAELERRHGLDHGAAGHLVGRYGVRSSEVAAYLEANPQLARRVVADEPDLQVEFVYQRDHEMAVRDADCLLRRTRLGLFRPELMSSKSVEAGVTHSLTRSNSELESPPPPV